MQSKCMCFSVCDSVDKGQKRDVEKKSVYQKIPQIHFLGYNIGISCIPSQNVNISNMSGIWKHVVFHVEMEFRVSTWSFLSVTIPVKYLFLCWKKKFGYNKKICTKLPKLTHEIP